MTNGLSSAGNSGRPGRRTARRILEREAYRRIAAGMAPGTLSEFAAQLSAWFKESYPAASAPPVSFVEAAIRDTWHRRHEEIGSEL